MNYPIRSLALILCASLTLAACSGEVGDGAIDTGVEPPPSARTSPLVTTGYFMAPLADGYFIAYVEDENTSTNVTVRSRTRAYIIWNADGQLVSWGDSTPRVDQLQVLGDELVTSVAANDLGAGDPRTVVLDPRTGEERGEPDPTVANLPLTTRYCITRACGTSDGWIQFDANGNPLISFSQASGSVSASGSDGKKLWTVETSGSIIGANSEYVGVWVDQTQLVVVLDATSGEQITSLEMPFETTSRGAAFVGKRAVALYDANRNNPTMYVYWF